MRIYSALFIFLLAFTAASAPLSAQTQAAQQAQAKSPEQEEIDKLTAENSLAEQRLKKELRLVSQEKDRLQVMLDKVSLENKLADEKRKLEIDAMEAEYQKLAEKNKLAAEKTRADMTAHTDDLQNISLENKISEEKNKKEVYLMSQRVDRFRAENDLKYEQMRELDIAGTKEKNAIDVELKRLDILERKLKMEKLVMDSRMDKLKSDLELRDKKEDWKKEANKDPVYLDRPFNNNKLVISDRRISLNGPIFTGVADFVTDRIHYFNNISSSPVFIVIDRSPGGSVMEGYRILKAMQASRAPVYVVVKSFAASMAAAIATLADKAYVYPNAIMLHHQMSTMNWGNMTQLKEQLELAKEWERRLAEPVAKKMGITLDQFRKKMYERNSDGDWQEFGDKAVENKWATSVVDEIEETGFTKNPDTLSGQDKSRFALDEKTDEKGQRYISLPRLEPFDFYFIYNPDRYYR